MIDLDASAELADELEQNAAPVFVDPTTIPTRFSLLKLMSLSPAHYLEACQQPQDDSLAARLGSMLPGARKKSEALRFGTAVHQFLLGKKERIGRYAGRRAGKAWDTFQEESAAAGCVEILNAREWAQATGVADAILRHDIASKLLLDDTIIEQRIDWTYCGKACRSTPDARGKTWIADLKTAQTAQPELFVRHAVRFFYHAQAWLYAEAIEDSEGSSFARPSDCYLVAVEKTRPMPVSVFRFTERTLVEGAKLCRAWIERVLACEATSQWPEYLQAIADFDLGEPELELEWNGRKINY